MANRIPNRANNALPEQQEITSNTQEVKRRLKNTSRDVPKEILEQTLKEYMGELQEGGYSLEWRAEVLSLD